jgi:hypothetical protein
MCNMIRLAKRQSMKRQMVATAIIAMVLAGGARAQSLEKSYADQCSTAAARKSEVCQVMAKALVAKLQGKRGRRSSAGSSLR